MTPPDADYRAVVDTSLGEVPPLVSKAYTAKLFDVSIRTVTEWISTGELACSRTSPRGGRVVIPRAALVDFLTRRRSA